MGDDVHHNGVLMLSDAVRFLNSMNTPAGHEPTDKMPRRGLTISPDERTFFLTERPTRADLTKLLAPNAFWEEMAEHPDYDEWWRARDTRRACYNIRPAMLVVGGTFDAEDCYGAWNLYKAVLRQSARTPLHLVVGPWAHGAWRGDGRTLGDFDFGEEASGAYYMEHFEAPFFDCYLWARDTVDRLPPVAAFSSGDNRWHTFGRWTPSEARKLTLYLADGGRITTEKPTVKNSSTSYTSDPADPVPYIATSGTRRPKEYMIADQRFLEGRKDVLTFVTEPLAEDVTLAGPVEASLKVALSTSDADFVVKLIDVYPDEGEKAGMQMLVRGDVVRGRYRDGFARPKAFVPGNPETVPFRTTDIAHTFRAGHRIMVQVQSSWFPLTERNPQQYVDLWRCAASDFVPCRVTLFHQRDCASSLTVYKL
ncbi:MAG: CocE/NonD family hydrolase [Alistipes shahii]